MVGVIVAILVAAATAAAVAWWRTWRALRIAMVRGDRLCDERDAARDALRVKIAELASRDALLVEMRRQLIAEIKLIGERIAANEMVL